MRDYIRFTKLARLFSLITLIAYSSCIGIIFYLKNNTRELFMYVLDAGKFFPSIENVVGIIRFFKIVAVDSERERTNCFHN